MLSGNIRSPRSKALRLFFYMLDTLHSENMVALCDVSRVRRSYCTLFKNLWTEGAKSWSVSLWKPPWQSWNNYLESFHLLALNNVTTHRSYLKYNNFTPFIASSCVHFPSFLFAQNLVTGLRDSATSFTNSIPDFFHNSVNFTRHSQKAMTEAESIYSHLDDYLCWQSSFYYHPNREER